MLTLLLILIIIACCLLVVIILAQNPKGGGLSNIGAGASQFLGARQTADFLEKSTWYFGIGILAVVVITYFLTGSPSGPEKTFKSRTEGAEAPAYAPAKPKQAAPAAAKPEQAAPANGNNAAPANNGNGNATPPPNPAPNHHGAR
jgi:preprotein translocase subunit SecG